MNNPPNKKKENKNNTQGDVSEKISSKVNEKAKPIPVIERVM